jgi:hypothetical protein
MTEVIQPKLDPRFRAVKAVPDPTPQKLSSGPGKTGRDHLHPIGKFFRAVVLLAPGVQLTDITLRLPTLTLKNEVQLLSDTFIIEAELDDLNTLARQPDVVYVEAPRPAGIDLAGSVAATRANLLWQHPHGPLTGNGVIIGIVDFNLDFTLADFKDVAGNTRVLSLWDQLLDPQFGRPVITPDVAQRRPVLAQRSTGEAHGDGAPGQRCAVCPPPTGANGDSLENAPL